MFSEISVPTACPYIIIHYSTITLPSPPPLSSITLPSPPPSSRIIQSVKQSPHHDPQCQPSQHGSLPACKAYLITTMATPWEDCRYPPWETASTLYVVSYGTKSLLCKHIQHILSNQPLWHSSLPAPTAWIPPASIALLNGWILLLAFGPPLPMVISFFLPSTDFSLDDALFLVSSFSLDCEKEGPLHEDADLLSGETVVMKSNDAFSLPCELIYWMNK